MKSFILVLLAALATSASASDPKIPRVPATDGEAIRAQLGQRVVVFGKVERTHDYQGKMTFVNFPGQVFTVVCFAKNYERFAKPPAELLADKYVEIIGIVAEFKGKLQIVLENSNQLLKVENPPAESGEPETPSTPETSEKPSVDDTPETPKIVDPGKFFDE